MRIILTAALTDAHYELRKQQYITACTTLSSLGYKDFYIVEALKKQGPTFLNEYCNNVFYSTANNPKFKNQGINEARTLLEACYHFKFDDDDMIVKLTGRYQCMSDYFLLKVKGNLNYDAIIKPTKGVEVYTVGFAIKCKYLKEMLEQIDCEDMERHWLLIEHEIGNYIRRKSKEGKLKVLYVNQLDIKADLLGSSSAPGASGVIIF